MSFFSIFNRNKHYGNIKWEDTEEGKAFKQQCIIDAKRRKAEKEEWERNTPYEHKVQIKLFKIIFAFFLFLFAALLFLGFRHNVELFVLLFETVFTFVCFIVWKIKPKVIKYPTCFLMPLIALWCNILLYVYMACEIFGFNPSEREVRVKNTNQTYSESEQDDGSEYFKFLEENNFLSDD